MSYPGDIETEGENREFEFNLPQTQGKRQPSEAVIEDQKTKDKVIQTSGGLAQEVKCIRSNFTPLPLGVKGIELRITLHLGNSHPELSSYVKNLKP